jgi:hypothetical protein
MVKRIGEERIDVSTGAVFYAPFERHVKTYTLYVDN